MTHENMRVRAEWRHRYREGEIVVHALGYRMRLYAGHTCVDRPLINRWQMREHRGVAVRLTHGVGRRRVFGAQWRPTVPPEPKA